MTKFKMIKDRLEGTLSEEEKLQVKRALWEHLGEEDPDLTKVTFKSFNIDRVLRQHKKSNSIWGTMTPAEFITSHPIINGVYHTIRNQFAKPDSLKKNIAAHMA